MHQYSEIRVIFMHKIAGTVASKHKKKRETKNDKMI